MYISDTHLKSLLADAGLVSQKDFDVAEKEAKESGRTVGEVLTSNNDIGEDELPFLANSHHPQIRVFRREGVIRDFRGRA